MQPMTARLLVVDDTPANIQTLAATLKPAGYQVMVATNGVQALEAMSRAVPDLILLDIMMPVMDGYEACAHIKANPAWREIPVIFLTAKTGTADLVRAFELGAVDYVSKPFNAHELLARVQTHLTMNQLRVGLAEKHDELARINAIVRSAFGRYVSEEVVTSILETPEGLEIGGEERELTILMSDLRGFTALTESLPPQEVIAALNVYLEAMVEVIFQFDGTIDEIIGDAILVMFGAPVARADHAARAVACGIAMQRAMADVNARLQAYAGPELEMGIGVHTGRVIVGNIGSARRTKYAAVGANVNMAGRIESFTTGGQLLVSESTRDAISAPLQVAHEFRVEPKGSARSITLFDVRGIGAPYDLALLESLVVMHPLPTPLAVQCLLLEDKAVGRVAHDGSLVACSLRDGELITTAPLVPLSNVKLLVAGTAADVAGGAPAGEIYAKVTSAADGDTQRARLRFTSVSPELKRWVQQLAP
jgi:class 3 adenylate cyclase/CheY-like chemotaxis protein